MSLAVPAVKEMLDETLRLDAGMRMVWAPWLADERSVMLVGDEVGLSNMMETE